MSVQYNQKKVERVFYNNKEVERIFYNGKEIELPAYRRFEKDDSKIGQTELSYQCKVGVAKVNVKTSRMTFEYHDMTIGEGNFKMNVSHIYNHKWEEKRGLKQKGYVGRGWKLNIEQYCYPYEENEEEKKQGFQIGDYVYIDSSGNKHRFVYYKQEGEERYYYDTTESNLVLKKYSNDTLEIIDPIKNKYFFSQEGYLTSFTSGIHSSIKKRITYQTKYKVDTYYDERKPNRKIQCHYNEKGLLESIECIEENESKKTFKYQYDTQENLISISESVNNHTKEVAHFQYTDNLLSLIVDAKDQSAIQIQYKKENETYKVNKIVSGVVKENAIPTNQTLSKSQFNYKENETIVENEKEIEFVYQFNEKGFTTAIFEKEGNNQNLRTLTKNGGWPLTLNGTNENKINGVSSKNIIDNKIAFNEKEFTKIFEKHDNGTESNYKYTEHYFLSFWLNLHTKSEKELQVNLKIDSSVILTSDALNYRVRIDHSAYNAWQYVSVPIEFTIDLNDVDLKKTITKMELCIEGEENINAEIADAYITVGSYSYPKINGFNLNGAREIGYVVNNQKTIMPIGKECFLTEQDIVQTYQNMYFSQKENSEKAFDLILCGGSKRIFVQKAFYRRKDGNEQYLSINSGIPNYLTRLEYRVGEEKWQILENKIQFYDTYVEQQTITNVEKTFITAINLNKATKIMSQNYYNGLIKQTKDAYQVIQEYQYDDYGNIEIIKTYNEKKKDLIMKKEFGYDSDISSLREVQTNVINDRIQSQETYQSPFFQPTSSTILGGTPPLYVKENKYNAYGDHLLTIQSDDGKLYHHLTYHKEGRLREVVDSSGQQYMFFYDLFGKVNSIVAVDENNKVENLLRKSYILDDNTVNHNSSIVETYFKEDQEVNKETIYNKYQQVQSIQDDGKKILYQYQNIAESPSLAQVSSIYDPYENQTYHFNYDLDNRPFGYTTTGSKEAQSHLCIRQLEENKTQYTFKNKNEQRISQIICEDQEVEEGNKVYLQPRIYKIKDGEIEKKYQYDGLGRLSKISFDTKVDGLYHDYYYKEEENLFYVNINSVTTNQIAQAKYHYNSIDLYVQGHYAYRREYDTTIIDDFVYDERGNVIKVNESHVTEFISPTETSQTLINRKNEINYQYDSYNRLVKETNTLLDLDYTFEYQKGKIAKVKNHLENEKEYQYNEKGFLKTLTLKDQKIQYVYDKFGNVNRMDFIDEHVHEVFLLSWERGNLLSQYGNYKYFNNYQGVRFKKEVNGLTKQYYLDSHKILGEDWSDGTKIRYYYDATGIAAMKYNNVLYKFMVDSRGNVRKIFHDYKLVCSYDYNSFGECKISLYDENGKQVNDTNHIGNINPFRWKSFYLDVETNLYYVQGRYYNPKSGSYLNADNPTRLLDNAYILNGLDRHAATLDNLVSKEINLLSIFTTNKYYPDPSYYSSEGKSWWDLNWKKVVAPALFVISIVLTLIPGTQCIGINMLQMGVKFAITGMIFGGVVSGIKAAIQGENIWKAVHEGMVNGFLDGYILGSIMGFVTSFTSVCGNCFKAGTLVLTSEGHKKIEDIQVGDKVWAYDEKSQSKRLKKVVQVFQNKTKKWLHIHINEEEIICTPEHPFYVINPKEIPTLQFEGREAFQYEGEWVASKDLKEGMQVLLANGKYATIEVVETEELDTFETTYNFEVEDDHTYFVGTTSILVHNVCTGSYDIEFKSGKHYVGKGSKARMNKSARRISHHFNDPVVNKTWTPAINNKVAFTKEYLDMAKYNFDFEGVLYNKIHSPGRLIFEQWF